MKSLFLIAVSVAALAAAPAQAHNKGMHHRHMAANPMRDSVTLDGKDYKVCSASVQDGCVNPRQAGLHYGNVPLEHDRGHDKDQHP